MGMALTKDDMQAFSDLLNERFKVELTPIRKDIQEMKGDIQNMKGDIQNMKGDIQNMKGDIQSLKGSVDLLNVKVDRNTRKLKGLDLAVRNLEYTSNKKFVRLQDGMDTIIEILRMNDLIPR